MIGHSELVDFTLVSPTTPFLNPLAWRNVIQLHVKEGKANILLGCFLHGTALKMYRWELDCKNPEVLHVKEGKANIPLGCSVHGTALKMYRWELDCTSPEEFLQRSTR